LVNSVKYQLNIYKGIKQQLKIIRYKLCWAKQSLPFDSIKATFLERNPRNK